MNKAEKVEEAIKHFKSIADSKQLENSNRLGIDTKKILGISI